MCKLDKLWESGAGSSNLTGNSDGMKTLVEILLMMIMIMLLMMMIVMMMI